MNKIDAHSTKCSSCGDNMRFSPENQSLVCVSCKSKKEIDVNTIVTKHKVVNCAETSNNGEDWANKNKAMKCPNCGAGVILQQYDISGICPYCETSLVVKKEALSSLKPDGVIPFAFDKEKAYELFKQKIKKNWFAPKALKKKLTTDEIRSYYFPAFVFDSKCKSTYSGVLRRYCKEEDSNGNTYTRTELIPISGVKDTAHTGIEVEAGTKLSQVELNSVRPYDFKKAASYSNDYILGFPLEYHSVNVKDSFKTASSIIKNDIKNEILHNYIYDEVESFNLSTTFISPHYSYFALPMHRINYTFKNKKYSNVINGQTGAVGGKIPKSAFKITLITILILLGIAIPFLLVLLLH